MKSIRKALNVVMALMIFLSVLPVETVAEEDLFASENPYEEAASLSVSSQYINFPAGIASEGAPKISVDVIANGYWEAQSDADWLGFMDTVFYYWNFNRVAYEGNLQAVIIALPNDGASRTGTITFTCGTETKRVTVTQAGVDDASNSNNNILDNDTGDDTKEIILKKGVTYKIRSISNENSFNIESSSTNDYFIFESICPWVAPGEWHHEMCRASFHDAGGSIGSVVYWTMLNCDVTLKYTDLLVTQINRSDIPCDLSLFDCTCFGENKKPQDETPSDCRAILNIYWTFIDENGNVPTVPFGHLTTFKETLSSVPVATFVTPDMYLVNAYMPSGYAYNHTLGSSAIVPADGDATGYVNIMSSKAWNENNTTVGEYSCYINYVDVDGNIVGKEPRYIAGKYGDIVSINCEIEGYWKDSPIGEYNVPEKVASIRCGIDFEITMRVNKLNNGNSQSEEATTDKPAPVFITGVPDPKFSSNPDTPAPVVITGVPDPKFVNTPSNGGNTGTTVNAENCQSLVGTVLVDFKNNALYSKNITGKGYKDEAKAKKAGKKGYSGQCISYAKRRFYELTGICIDETAVVSYASQMLKENEKSKKVTVIYDTSNIKAPAMAVTEGMTEGKYAGMGHVLIIEYVERDSQGNPIKVYFTESNIGGKLYGPDDGKLQCLTFTKFLSNKNPLGYIIPK